MKKLEFEKMEGIEGGCSCSGVGICCSRFMLSIDSYFTVDLAVCFGCDGSFAYAEAW